MGEPLKFHLITDLHHYAASLGTTGSAYEWRSQSDQKCLAETGAIIDAAVDWLLQSEIDIILVAGDVSCDGEKESHLELIPKLNRLREAGKRVILITATHDYSETPIRCVGDERLPATPTTREELLELYHDFGLNEAIAFHAETHSYAVQLAPGWRMLALNDDGDGRAFCGYSEDQLHWILDQVKLAHEAGDEVLAMTHHPVLPPSPIYPLFSRRDMLGDFEHTSTVLADAGVQFIFTGHTHMQNIAVKTTEKGNTIYDINTSALIGYASAIRTVAVYDDRMEVTSDHIDHFDWDLHGMTVMSISNRYSTGCSTIFLTPWPLILSASPGWRAASAWRRNNPEAARSAHAGGQGTAQADGWAARAAALHLQGYQPGGKADFAQGFICGGCAQYLSRRRAVYARHTGVSGDQADHGANIPPCAAHEK